MNRPTPARLIFLALLLSVTSSLALVVLSLLSLPVTITQVIVTTLGAYCLLLIGWMRPPVGRVSGCLVTGLVTLATLLACAYWGALSGPGVLFMLAWTWLVRWALLHRSVAAVLSDGMLLAGGVVGAAWAFESGGSISLTIWTFFLLQALLPWLPVGDRTQAQNRQSVQSRFDQANQRAEQALRRLYVRTPR